MQRKYALTSCVLVYTEYRHARLLLCLHKSTLTNWFRWNPESRGIKNLYAQIKLVGWCETITQPSQTRWGGRILHRCICAVGSTVSSLAEDDKKVGSKNTGRHKANPLASNLVHSLHSWAIGRHRPADTCTVWCGATWALLTDFQSL